MNKNQQLIFPGIGLENCGHVRMGVFYELMTTGIFGGKLFDSVKEFKEMHKGWIRPDVLNDRELFESKALRQGQQLNLIDEQINKYKMFQILHPKDVVYYAIWRHGFKGNIQKTCLSLDELHRVLSKNTYACIVMPFSIIWTMFESSRFKRYKGAGDAWPPCTRIGSKFVNDFLFTTEDCLSVLNLDDQRFTVDKRLSPKDFWVEGKQVKTFPFVFIKDNNHQEWVEEVLDETPF